MTAEEINSATKKELVGEILIRRKLIGHDQLNRALEVQKKEGGYVGGILVKLGYVEERDIVIALVVQCNFPYIAVDKYEIDRKIIQLISKEMARKSHVIPLDRVGDVLSVVMADPLDLAVKAELQRMTNCRVATFIATKAEITRAIERWYGKE